MRSRCVLPRTAFLLFGPLGLLSLLGLAACGDAPGWEGRWRGPTGTEMIVTRSGSEVSITLDGETATGRLVGSDRVEGTHTNDEGTLDFVLTLDGDRMRAKFKIVVRGQEINPDEAVFERIGAGGAVASGGATSGGATSSGAGTNTALVGHWRHTEVLGSGGFSHVTDTHYVFEAGGRFTTWSRSAGSAGESSSGETGGDWKTDGATLHVRHDGSSWEVVGTFQLSGNSLLLVNPAGGKRVYERL